MPAPFSVIPPGVFLDKPLRVEKARNDINKVDTPPLDIPLSLLFMPFKLYSLLYAQIVCTIKHFHKR